MITGINHITLSVRNLEESISFYSNVLDFRLLAKWPKGAYLSAGDIWLALILDQKVRESPLPEYTHIGLTVSVENFPVLSQNIFKSGAKMRKTICFLGGLLESILSICAAAVRKE